MVQSTPMVHPTVSRISALPMAFQLSPIIHHSDADYSENSETLHTNNTTIKKNLSKCMKGEKLFSNDRFSVPEDTCIEPSIWIGGNNYSKLY